MDNKDSHIAQLEANLNDFDAQIRQNALLALCNLVKSGEIIFPPERDIANLHCHTIFSYNAYNYSPTGLAWLGKRQGYKYVGIVDFDVLDGVDEFLHACDCVGLRGSAGIETRVFLPEFSTRELNSPSEPGVTYHMGIGFSTGCLPGGASNILTDLAQRSEERNRGMVERLNAHLTPVKLDYDKDVIPLTPSGNATERHILAAYTKKADTLNVSVDFWAQKLNLPVEKLTGMRADVPTFHNTIRSKLMKRGGIAYVQPGAGMFPDVDSVHQMIVASEALPCVAWLDGTSTGEQDIEELLQLMVDKGASTLNIVPDRNWNIADPRQRQIKVQNLYKVVELAQQMDLPINVGTEMNSFGQKLVDDFDAPELEPVRQAFLDGADFIFGHTSMQRALGMGAQSDWARTAFPGLKQRNQFYQQVGQRLLPGTKALQQLKRLSPVLTPAAVLEQIKNFIQ
jgi:hypothetical protein